LFFRITDFWLPPVFFNTNGQLSSLLAESFCLIQPTFLLGTFRTLLEFSNSTLHLFGPVCRLSSRRLTSTLDFDSLRISTRPFGHPSFTAFSFLARHTSPLVGPFLPPALPLLLDLTGNLFCLLPELVGLIASTLSLSTRGSLFEFGKLPPHPFNRLFRARPTKPALKRSLDFLGLGLHTPGPLLELPCLHLEFFNPFSRLRKLPKHRLFVRTNKTILIPVELTLQVGLNGHSFLTG
jgi:hypothetical protein